MSKISKCSGCKVEFYISDYNGVKCSVCGDEFCDYCDRDYTIWMLTKDGNVKLCKSCIEKYKEKGVEWLKSQVFENTTDFDEPLLTERIKEFEKQIR